jgi:hypothetical protein
MFASSCKDHDETRRNSLGSRRNRSIEQTENRAIYSEGWQGANLELAAGLLLHAVAGGLGRMGPRGGWIGSSRRRSLLLAAELTGFAAWRGLWDFNRAVYRSRGRSRAGFNPGRIGK